MLSISPPPPPTFISFLQWDRLGFQTPTLKDVASFRFKKLADGGYGERSGGGIEGWVVRVQGRGVRDESEGARGGG